MNRPAPSRDFLIHAVDVLNDLITDFITGTNVLRHFIDLRAKKELGDEHMVGVQKMCLSHLILGAAKYDEFYERFHQAIPDSHRIAAKKLLREIHARGLISFRNKVVGHIWDNERGRPLLLSEITAELQAMSNNDISTFLNWFNDPRKDKDSITSLVESIRGSIMEIHGITPDEAINR